MKPKRGQDNLRAARSVNHVKENAKLTQICEYNKIAVDDYLINGKERRFVLKILKRMCAIEEGGATPLRSPNQFEEECD